MSNQEPKLIVTHSGTFHSDEVFAVATLQIHLAGTPVSVLRTRDPELIAQGDYVVDVGWEDDPDRERFDHHQAGGAGTRENGIPFSSFGLVWKKYGSAVCGSKEAAEIVEHRLVWPIDAADSGMDTYSRVDHDLLRPYIFHNVTEVFRPTWRELNEGRTLDKGFMETVEMARTILRREIKHAQDEIEGMRFVETAYANAPDKRVIEVSNHCPWARALAKYPEPLLVIKPDIQNGGRWKVKTVRSDPDSSFENRRDLPAAWAGKRDQELAEVTGVPDALFCHAKRFIIVAGSKEGARTLAWKALEWED
jgi:uncharacterized UPF0160 family protein